ncbi:energy-coupling factor ABC transporter permease [Shewanella sp. 125m-7]
MHMNDALLSSDVGLPLLALSGGALIIACKIAQQRIFRSNELMVLMAVLGAFVFAIQMINFAIPGTGASGHITGAILLSALLGAPAAFVVIASILIVQALFFADGGLLALGANLVNLGIVPCFIIFPLVWQPLAGRSLSRTRLALASISACMLALIAGAAGIAIMTHLSGITRLPLAEFLLFIIPIHAVIGIVEGAATAAILYFAYHQTQFSSQANTLVLASRKSQVIAFGMAALLCAAVLSRFASSSPDGLEWTMDKLTLNAIPQSLPAEALQKSQQALTLFPDYQVAGVTPLLQTPMAGVIGSLVTLGIILALFAMIKVIKRATRYAGANK